MSLIAEKIKSFYVDSTEEWKNESLTRSTTRSDNLYIDKILSVLFVLQNYSWGGDREENLSPEDLTWGA